MASPADTFNGISADAGLDREVGARHDLVDVLRQAAKGLDWLTRLKISYRPAVSPLHLVLGAVPPGIRLYDIGCGGGALLHLASKLRGVAAAHGYDVQPAAVDAARRVLCDQAKARVELRTPNSQFPDLSTYDVVTMLDVLHHLPSDDQDAFLIGLARAMAPGARLILSDIDATRPMARAINQIHDLLLAREWVHPRRPGAVTDILHGAGLEIRLVRRCRSLWYCHFMIVAEKPLA